MSTDLQQFRLNDLPPAIQLSSSLTLKLPEPSDESSCRAQSESECVTPTSPENRIPEILACPPAPKKQRRSAPSCKRRLCEFQFFEVVAREEIDSFFRFLSSFSSNRSETFFFFFFFMIVEEIKGKIKLEIEGEWRSKVEESEMEVMMNMWWWSEKNFQVTTAFAAGLRYIASLLSPGLDGSVHPSPVAVSAGIPSPAAASSTVVTPVAEPIVESPAGTSGVIGDVGSFQQLLRDVSGAQGLQQQSSMLSPAAALFSSFLVSPVGMGSGRGVLPTASSSEAATLSSPGLKPSADKFIEVGSNTDNEPNLSEVKAPNAGSFVDSEGKVHLHADETDVAHKPVSFADLLKKSANLVCGKGKLTYYPPVVTELGTRRAIIPDELI
ncbi:hypothetical protein OSB04_017699 [Centaurea solstitialis]|uniref:Uncharacterized protein n=1 Tax=Centaurea solstitialis TaxID=347529 RepID=A0AA38WKZ6_9ASTR|nr:hypothetical protein OSB04_017699 [Centaurea solstitialis]